MKPVDYKQTDLRWSGKDYSAPGEKTTIGKAGCGPTCMAMVIATLADAKITPADTAEWSLQHGYKAPKQGTYYTYFGPQGNAFGIEVERINTTDLRTMGAAARQHHDKALQAISDGHMVICCMGPGLWTKGGHYILWHGMDGGQALINDPGSSRAERAKAPLALLQGQVKYYWVIEVPKGGEDEDMERIKVIVNDKATEGLLSKDGVSYVPARVVSESLGATVAWDGATKTVTIKGRA